MRKKFNQFMLSAILFYAFDTLAKNILVTPDIISVSSFLPPILGFIFGPVAAVGVAVGKFLTNIFSPNFVEILATFMWAYIPFSLWRTVYIHNSENIFDFNNKNVMKFVQIIFATNILTSLIIGAFTGTAEIAKIFEGTSLTIQTKMQYAAVRFFNDFDCAIFFGLPIFFILISRDFKFYGLEERPNSLDEVSEMNRVALYCLFGFFIIMFLNLDLSGIIYDLDKIDNWLRFNLEILTVMDLTLVVTVYMLLRYRHSIMTNLMLLEIVTVFVVASIFGSVSFYAINGIIGNHIDNDLQKMSVVYRERLSHTFNSTRLALNGIEAIALNRLNYDRLLNDENHRREYLKMVEEDFVDIAEKSSGIIAVYMSFSENEDIGFLCTRKVENWGTTPPKFTHQNVNPYHDRYHIPQERYLAKWSEPYYDENSDRYIISCVAPLKLGDKFIGMVGLDIDFNFIVHEIKRMLVYEHGYVSLLDKNGNVFYTSQKDGEHFFERKGFYETETYLNNGVWLKIAASAHDIYADRNNMLMHSVVGVLLVIIAVSILSIWLAERGIKPLMLITEAAKKIADGNLDVQLSYTARNELGVLVESIKEMVAKLEIYVYRDKLTGLKNNTAYVRKIDELNKKSESENIEYAVAVFDANFLKRTNDTYGHNAGNELIIRAANLIERIFLNSMVYRIGGDEFVAIIEGLDYDNREELLKDFDSESAKEYFFVRGEKINVSVARGIALYHDRQIYSDVFKKADAEMYKHKTEIKSKMGLPVNSR